jgi:hypothetical protein
MSLISSALLIKTATSTSSVDEDLSYEVNILLKYKYYFEIVNNILFQNEKSYLLTIIGRKLSFFLINYLIYFKRKNRYYF